MAARRKQLHGLFQMMIKQVINLEHVLQKAREITGQNSTTTSRSYSKRLGNLALLLAKNNSDLKSSDFKTKKISIRTAV